VAQNSQFSVSQCCEFFKCAFYVANIYINCAVCGTVKTASHGIQTDKKQLAVFTSFNILANNFLPLNGALWFLEYEATFSDNSW
jgi:hypothetical protein